MGILKEALGVPPPPAPTPWTPLSGRWLIITSTLPFIDEEDLAKMDVLGVAAAAPRHLLTD